MFMKKRGKLRPEFLCNNSLLNSKHSNSRPEAVKLKNIFSASKCSQAGNIALLAILGVAIAIIIIWLLFSKVLIKTSTVFCEETRYILYLNVNETELFENFNRGLCKEDCIGFCSNLSYGYEGHYRTSCKNPRVTHACGCRCN